MNDETKTQIDSILNDYLLILQDGQADLFAAYQTNEPVTYMKAIERHERTARGVKDAAEGLYTLIDIGENVRELTPEEKLSADRRIAIQKIRNSV